MSITIELALKEIISGKKKSSLPSFYWNNIEQYRSEIFSSAILTGSIEGTNRSRLHEQGVTIESIEVTIVPAYKQSFIDGFYLLEESEDSWNTLKGAFTLDSVVFSRITQMQKNEKVELDVEIPLHMEPNKEAINRALEYQFIFRYF